jgi:hypothetical protein
MQWSQRQNNITAICGIATLLFFPAVRATSDALCGLPAKTKGEPDVARLLGDATM